MEERRLHETMLMMALLRPRIGKEDKDRGKSHVVVKRFQKHLGLSLDEMEVAEPGSVALAKRAFNPFAGDISAHANSHRMSACVSRQKMPVPAPNLPIDDLTVVIVQNCVEMHAQVLPTIMYSREVRGCSSWIVHVGIVRGAQVDAVLLLDSNMIMRTLMSAGLTPLIREA
jgi:hypothetical protein